MTLSTQSYWTRMRWEAKRSLSEKKNCSCGFLRAIFISTDDVVRRRGYCDQFVTMRVNIKIKVHTLDIAPLRSESPPQKCSGMARVLKGFHSFTCTPTRSSAIGMSHTCLCLPSYN